MTCEDIVDVVFYLRDTNIKGEQKFDKDYE